jgi:formylglycine-generating enzyme required for sulfatase activity
LTDITGDCFVDLEDFEILMSYWLDNTCQDPNWCQGADLNHSNTTDFFDFAMIANDWLTGNPNLPDDMTYIPGGEFEMGDSFNEGSASELPVHTVSLDAFFIGKYEVTNAQYCQYLNSALGNSIYVSGDVVYGSENNQPYCDMHAYDSDSQIDYSGGVFSVRTKPEVTGRDMSNDPVVEVSWYGAVAYCNWRSSEEGFETCYDINDPNWECDFSKHGYRLPTEAEWEYAARGGLAAKRFPWGDTITHSQANYYSSSSYSYDISPTEGFHPTWNDGIEPYTSPTGSFYDNGLRTYDMAGNVWEWCNDWYSSTYYSSSPTNNPTGPTSEISRVLRSGGWGYGAYFCRVATRYSSTQATRYGYFGFRLSLDLE